MTRWVVKEYDGSLGIVTTSGKEPPNVLCKALDEWNVHQISEYNGVVYLDPEKSRKIKEAHDKYDAFEARQKRHKQLLKLWAKVSPIIYLIIGFSLGKIL